ncbi:hypothetical protein MSAN_00514900 [Mycena sanguinolenta]|uniref:Uncharacterized protein n=1 Tax=Mycena sanguinolenta TaxID=230812 RepID=A0A8H6Z944_9AGAR|nr:hypothetical protein MSAN_00514900 [Mycena sanguinolenta]
MPPSSQFTTERIPEYTAVAANALRDVATATQIPFLNQVCTLALELVPIVQNTKFQKARCFRIMEEIHHLLSALASLSIQSEDMEFRGLWDDIAQHAVILQKIDSCLRAQQELGKVKRLFKQSEITTQLDACEAELRAALNSFTMKQRAETALAVAEFSIDGEKRNQELLELISTRNSSFYSVLNWQKLPQHQFWIAILTSRIPTNI